MVKPSRRRARHLDGKLIVPAASPGNTMPWLAAGESTTVAMVTLIDKDMVHLADQRFRLGCDNR